MHSDLKAFSYSHPNRLFLPFSTQNTFDCSLIKSGNVEGSYWVWLPSQLAKKCIIFNVMKWTVISRLTSKCTDSGLCTYCSICAIWIILCMSIKSTTTVRKTTIQTAVVNYAISRRIFSNLPSLQQRNVPLRLVSITAFQPLAVILATGLVNCPPPLFTKKSIFPWSFRTEAIMFLTCQQGHSNIFKQSECLKCWHSNSPMIILIWSTNLEDPA